MSVHGTVYCDCYERGLVRSPPPYAEVVHVAPQGWVEISSDSTLEECLQFDKWRSDACEHPSGMYVSHWIGNIARVALLRGILGNDPGVCPTVLAKIVHNGVHSGDHLDRADIERVVVELARLDPSVIDRLTALPTTADHDLAITGITPDKVSAVKRECLVELQWKLRELADAAMALGRPICF